MEKEFLFEGPWNKFLVYESKKFPKTLEVVSVMMNRVAFLGQVSYSRSYSKRK